MGGIPPSVGIHESWKEMDNDDFDPSTVIAASAAKTKTNAVTRVYDDVPLSEERIESLTFTARNPAHEERLQKRASVMALTIATIPKVDGFFTYKQILGMGGQKLSLWGPEYSKSGTSICESGMPILDNTVVSLNYEANGSFLTAHEEFPSLFCAMAWDKNNPDWLKTFCTKVQQSGSVLFLMTEDELISTACIEERKAVLSLQRPIAVYFGFQYDDEWVLRLAISMGGVLALANVPPCLSTELRMLDQSDVNDAYRSLEAMVANGSDDESDDD